MPSKFWIRFGAGTVAILVAAGIGIYMGWQSATVNPPAPPSTCQLIRPEMWDRLVPRHGPVRDEREDTKPGVRSTACQAEGLPTVDGIYASLWVSLNNFGRHDGEGPRCIARHGILRLALNRTHHPVPLGDGAAYFLEGNADTGRVIHFVACLGTHYTYVVYETRGINDAAMAESATMVTQEVLSQL